MNEQIVDNVKQARENSKGRNFTQSFDLIVNLKLLDTKKPENKINEIIILPKGRGKDSNITIFSENVTEGDYTLLKSDDIQRLEKNKRELKKTASDTDFFLADPKLMVEIGKSLGKILAPRGKMPKPIVGDHNEMVKRLKKSIVLKIKDSPVIQCLVGVENMKDEDIAENIEFVLNFLERRLPKGRNNIGKIMLKTTMGKPVKIEM